MLIGVSRIRANAPKILAIFPCNIMSRNVSSQIESGFGAGGDAGSLYDRVGRRKYLNAAERANVLRVMRTLRPDHALFALTLAWTGARVSEILALTPASFQVDQQLVTIQTLKRRRHSVREVPIPAGLMNAINASYRLRALQQDSAMATRRLWPWHRVTAWRIIKAVMAAAHVVGCQSSPRGLRHGFGVGALRAKVPLNLVQRWLGHARMTTTAIYANASGPEELEFAARFWKST